MEQVLLDVLRDNYLGTPQDGELAFLALTSKIEIQFRDRLAWQIQKRISSSGAVVAREWKKRIDLAVLSPDHTPRLLVELKSLHAFDLFDSFQRAHFQRSIKGDAQKLAKVKTDHHLSHASGYVLALITSCEANPSSAYEGIIKYQDRIRKCGPLHADAIQKETLSCFGTEPLDVNKVCAGTAFGVPVHIHYALYRCA